MRNKKIIVGIIIFLSCIMFESCKSGFNNKHCTGKKTKNTQRIKRMAPGMAR